MSIIDINNVLDEQKEEPTQVIDNVVSQPEETKTGGSVVLDGPLGKAYTNALNIVYAKEGMAGSATQVASIVDSKEEEIEKDKAEQQRDMYVYCCDSSDMKQDELIESVNKLRIALDSKKYKKVMLSVEHSSDINSKLTLLENYGRSLGIKVCLSRNSALEAIVNTFKG